MGRVSVVGRIAVSSKRFGLVLLGALLAGAVLLPSVVSAPSAQGASALAVLNGTVREGAKTLADAPASLRAAVSKELGLVDPTTPDNPLSSHHQLGATYTLAGAQFSGSGFSFGVGVSTVDRGSATTNLAPDLVHKTDAATYGSGSLTESFKPVTAGIEQTFQVAKQLRGSGPLSVNVPISGLTAVTSGTTIDLESAPNRILATYTGLKVTDAAGNLVPSTMAAASGGSAIDITVYDAHFTYPLTIDPTWTQVELFTTSTLATENEFGAPIVISGTTAAIGAAEWSDDVGAVYIFTESGGIWTQSAELTASDSANGYQFGSSIAISGSMMVIGSPGHTEGTNADQGAAYIFTGSGSSWTQEAEFTSSDGGASDEFGDAVAVAGSTVVVGARYHEAGDLTGIWSYDAFGTLANGTPTSPFGYGGQYTDATTGFGVNRARYYNSATGTFTTRDAAFSSTDTAYTYAGGDPVNGGDPSGLCSDSGDVYLVPGPCKWSSSTWVNWALNNVHAQYAPPPWWEQGLEGDADFGAGIANTVVSGITLGSVHISAPFCQYAWAYGFGEIYATTAVGLLGVGEVDAAGDIATATTAIDDSLADSPTQWDATSSLFSRSGVRSNVDVLANGGGLPVSLDTVTALAEAANIDLRGTTVTLWTSQDEAVYLDMQGAVGLADSNIDSPLFGEQMFLGPGAFSDEETLVGTIAHEQMHLLQLQAGVEVTSESLDALEEEAEAEARSAIARYNGALTP